MLDQEKESQKLDKIHQMWNRNLTKTEFHLKVKNLILKNTKQFQKKKQERDDTHRTSNQSRLRNCASPQRHSDPNTRREA